MLNSNDVANQVLSQLNDEQKNELLARYVADEVSKKANEIERNHKDEALKSKGSRLTEWKV